MLIALIASNTLSQKIHVDVALEVIINAEYNEGKVAVAPTETAAEQTCHLQNNINQNIIS